VLRALGKPLQREVRRGLEEVGHRVIAIAPTASGAKTLQSEGFREATTVADFLQNGPSKFDLRGVVVICDEAGLQSNRQGEELLRRAQKHDLRLIFVGEDANPREMFFITNMNGGRFDRMNRRTPQASSGSC
jgi:AAA domain